MIAGVAYFDDPTSMTGGWCSVAEGRAVRFNSPAELDPSVIWVTNMKMGDHRSSQLNMTAHIRNMSFFHLSLPAIAAELDIKQDDPIPQVVEQLSGATSRIIDVALIAFPGMRLGSSLSDSIYEHLGFRDQQNDPARQYQPQLQAAFQENSIVTGAAWMPGSENVRLVPNRVTYAEMLLSYPMPIGALREVQGDMSIDDFINIPHPAIAQVDVNIAGADNPELIAFGVQMSGTAVPREWVTQPEAYFMRESGVKFIKIHRVIRSDASDVMPVLPSEITKNAFFRSSYSAGVVAENLIVALSSKRYMRTASKTAKTKYFFPTRAIYLRSLDRMLSFAIAKKLFECELRVTRYGFGGVEVRAVEDEIPAIMEIGADFGFVALSVSRLGKDGV